MTITIISIAIATIIPIISLYIIYTRDLYSTGSKPIIGFSFAWGIIAFFLAFSINRFLLNSVGVDWLVIARFIAPIEEEILKGVIILFLVRRKQFTNFVDGAIYGFSIGIGFAVIENWSYLLSSEQNFQLMLAVVRVISTNLMHAAGSSIIGIAMGRSRLKNRAGQVQFAFGGLFVSGSLHVVFNVVSNSPINSTLVLIITITLIGIISYGFIISQIRRGLLDNKAAIEKKLGMADRVTAGETQAVLSLEKLDEVFEDLAVMFGEQKARYMEDLLKKQALLGILRRNQDEMQDPALLETNREEMVTVRAEMDELRGQIGAYPMLFLRGIFPEDESPLWDGLANIDETAGPQPGGIWDHLNQSIGSLPAKQGEDN